jgi:adenine deaminase
VFIVRYEYLLRIESKAISVTGRGGTYVFPVSSEHHLHVESKAITVNTSGGTYVCFQ